MILGVLVGVLLSNGEAHPLISHHFQCGEGPKTDIETRHRNSLPLR